MPDIVNREDLNQEIRAEKIAVVSICSLIGAVALGGTVYGLSTISKDAQPTAEDTTKNLLTLEKKQTSTNSLVKTNSTVILKAGTHFIEKDNLNYNQEGYLYVESEYMSGYINTIDIIAQAYINEETNTIEYPEFGTPAELSITDDNQNSRSDEQSKILVKKTV